MSKDRPRIRYFNMGAWPIYVGFTASEKAFNKEMKRLSVKEPGRFIATTHANATTHYFENEGTLTCIITMGSIEGRSNEQVASLIAHEAVHVAQELWRHVGEKTPGHEQEAYLVQQIVQECLQDLWKSNMTKRTEPVA